MFDYRARRLWYPGGDHTLHHNIVFCNTRAGIDQDINPDAPRNFFYNNTCYGNSRNGIMLDVGGAPPSVKAIVKNNIFASNGLGGPYAPKNDYGSGRENAIDVSDYNFIADGVFPTNEAGDLMEGENSLIADGTPGDPLFVDPYIKDWPTGVISNSEGALDKSWQGTLIATMDHIRSQVESAFTLQTIAGGFLEDSPCLNAGVEIPAVTTGFSGDAPDIGALETPEL